MKVSVLGCGTIGRGIYGILKTAEGFEPGPVLERKGYATEDFMVDDIDIITSDPTIDAVVESIGGIEPAYTYAVKAINAGKHFVTTNKALVADKGLEIAALAREKGVGFLFSAACGGGMPYLHNIAVGSETDKIIALEGILNGTTNFILDSMQRKGMTYSDALKEAQALGYAERDPSADVSGLDTQRKIVLACACAFGKLPTTGLRREGIESFTAEDAADLKNRKLVVRLMAKAGLNGNDVYAFVEPVVVRADSTIASIQDNFNLGGYIGENSGSMRIIGQGAGRWPTATNAMRDLTGIRYGTRAMMKDGTVEVSANNDIMRRYYVRVPKECASLFDVAYREEIGGTARLFTNEVSVNEMHDAVRNLREEGVDVFFASVE